MSEKHGIGETKDAFIASNELAIFMVERLKDGADIGDAIALLTKLISDDEFQAVLKKALDGADKVPSELHDLSITEGMELAMMAINYVPRYVAAFQK